jgi:hypothetical protein
LDDVKVILEEDVHLFFSFSMRCAYMLFEDSPFKKDTATVHHDAAVRRTLRPVGNSVATSENL